MDVRIVVVLRLILSFRSPDIMPDEKLFYVTLIDLDNNRTPKHQDSRGEDTTRTPSLSISEIESRSSRANIISAISERVILDGWLCCPGRSSALPVPRHPATASPATQCWRSERVRRAISPDLVAFDSVKFGFAAALRQTASLVVPAPAFPSGLDVVGLAVEGLKK